MPLIWTLTDGKAGDVLQCMGVAEALIEIDGGSIEQQVVRPRPLYALATPWGPADPRDMRLMVPPYPAIAIASGRRAVPPLRVLKRRSPRTFTVFLKYPRTGRGAADFIWVPAHDGLRGKNVMSTLTSPHRLTPATLAAARAWARPELKALALPRVAILAGGPSKDVAFDEEDIGVFAAMVRDLAKTGAGLMATPSRRTPGLLTEALRDALGHRGFLWDGEGLNPYAAMLGLADAIVVTADSVNMLGEAAATGKPVHVFMPKGVPPKVQRFIDGLIQHGAVVKFTGRLENFTYTPLDSTPLIAQEIMQRFRRFLER